MKKIKKKLVGIVSGAIIVGTLSGFLGFCALRRVDNSGLNFKGKIGNEQVEFRQDISFWPNSKKDTNYLTITGESGETSTYIDRGNDLILDEVVIGDEVYRNDALGKWQSPLELEQKKFNDYLIEILISKL